MKSLSFGLLGFSHSIRKAKVLMILISKKLRHTNVQGRLTMAFVRQFGVLSLFIDFYSSDNSVVFVSFTTESTLS